MANNEPQNGEPFEDPGSSGEPFNIEEPKDSTPESTSAVDNAPDGYIRFWNPIPHLKQLLERVIPLRRQL